MKLLNNSLIIFKYLFIDDFNNSLPVINWVNIKFYVIFII